MATIGVGRVIYIVADTAQRAVGLTICYDAALDLCVTAAEGVSTDTLAIDVESESGVVCVLLVSTDKPFSSGKTMCAGDKRRASENALETAMTGRNEKIRSRNDKSRGS